MAADRELAVRVIPCLDVDAGRVLATSDAYVKALSR